MNDDLKLLLMVLAGEISPLQGGNLMAELAGGAPSALERTRIAGACRLCSALAELEQGDQGVTWWDIMGLLRHNILNYKQKITVSQPIAKHVNRLKLDFGLAIDSDNEVNALLQFPAWLKGGKQLAELHEFTPRRLSCPVAGDGMLYSATGYYQYASGCQKAAVGMAMGLPDGYTLLVCLPTGGGKSLVAQMPAYYATGGGGSTVVIVPTVALAMDQAKSAQAYFRGAADIEHRPAAYYSGMPDDERQAIFRGLKNGTMPLVYISPEAILGGGLSDILLEAHSMGRLKYLVIDEAHIVDDWGGSFRPDFQFLAFFRKKLLQEGGPGIRTILLSATLSQSTVGLLRELYSEEGKFIQVRGDALRPETMFWLDRSGTEEERREKIMELLPLLPRPIIIYVTRPLMAEEWLSLLKSRGVGRVGMCTGETSPRAKKDLLNRWMSSEIDIMVATSAFGMGVDKADVRAVIHCCLPESLNRFYQEVGRGGRDGFPSFSLLSTVPMEDSNETFNLIKGSVLTAENMASRWTSMRQSPQGNVVGDKFWADTDSRPRHLQNEITGRLNAHFNEVTLLFLYRRGLIEILDTQILAQGERRSVLLRMKRLDLLEDEDRLVEYLNPCRLQEREVVFKDYDKMKEMAYGGEKICLAENFSDVYIKADVVCGGCPSCRNRGRGPDTPSEHFQIQGMYHEAESAVKLSGKLRSIVGRHMEWMLFTDNLNAELKNRISLAAKLINMGVKSLVLPQLEKDVRQQWASALPSGNCPVYTVLTLEEVILGRCFIPPGAIAIFYPERYEDIKRCYQWAQGHLGNSTGVLIHVAPREVFIQHEGKLLRDLIEGGTFDSKYLLEAN